MSDTITDFDPFADLSDDELDAMIEAAVYELSQGLLPLEGVVYE